MNQARIIFEHILYNQVLPVPEWRTFISVIFDAGICSVNTLVATRERTINNLNIPRAPLDLLIDLQKQLKAIHERNRDTNTFIQPLNENLVIRGFEFAPCFDPVDYIRDIQHMTDKEGQMKTAIEKVNSVAREGLTRHQAIMIALYCQEGKSPHTSFYYLLNRALRNRTDELVSFRPSLHLLNAGLRSLPSVETTTWRGQNVAPDLTKFVVGRVVCFTGICSTSEDKQSTLGFMETAPADGTAHKRTLFKLEMKQGYSIQQWSPYNNEQEVVAGFCSRWRVHKVNFNHLEDFGPIGSYHCDVYIELEQLAYEPLFDTTASPLCGLHLLSIIDTSRLTEFPKDFKSQFIELFGSLVNDDTQNILVKTLGDQWNSEAKRFRGDVSESEAMKLVLNVLVPAKELRNTLTFNETDVRQCLTGCQNNQIYTSRELFFVEGDEERTITQFLELNFSDEDSHKLYDQHGYKQILLKLYAAVIGLKGDSENPKNVKEWLAKNRFKHYVCRDGMMVGLYQAVQCVFNMVVCCNTSCLGSKEVCRFVYKSSGAIVQRGDVIIAVVIGAVHLSSYLLQWWYGDITLRQLLKSIFVTATSMSLGFIAVLLVIAFGPAGIVGSLVGLGVGALAGGTSEIVIRKIVESLFPDGVIEETNAKRLLYHKALKILNCSVNSSWHEVQTQYRQLAQLYFPKQKLGKEPHNIKDSDMENYHNIVAAYEIVQTYSSSLNAACQRLNIPRDTLSKETLAHWNKVDRKSMPDCVEVKKSYAILDMHVNYTSKDLSWLRSKLSMHHVASLTKELTLIPFASNVSS